MDSVHLTTHAGTHLIQLSEPDLHGESMTHTDLRGSRRQQIRRWCSARVARRRSVIKPFESFLLAAPKDFFLFLFRSRRHVTHIGLFLVLQPQRDPRYSAGRKRYAICMLGRIGSIAAPSSWPLPSVTPPSILDKREDKKKQPIGPGDL